MERFFASKILSASVAGNSVGVAVVCGAAHGDLQVSGDLLVLRFHGVLP